jgi:hypothetical protein
LATGDLHDLVNLMTNLAILEVSNQNFRPGMPGYGQRLHAALAAQIAAFNFPGLVANPVYFGQDELDSGPIPSGASVPDIVYAPRGIPRVVWKLKSGRAADTSSPAYKEQEERTLSNLPPGVIYLPLLVREE